MLIDAAGSGERHRSTTTIGIVTVQCRIYVIPGVRGVDENHPAMHGLDMLSSARPPLLLARGEHPG